MLVDAEVVPKPLISLPDYPCSNMDLDFRLLRIASNKPNEWEREFCSQSKKCLGATNLAESFLVFNLFTGQTRIFAHQGRGLTNPAPGTITQLLVLGGTVCS